VLPPQFPVPGGMQADEVRSVLAGLVAGGRLVGLEVTAFEAPEHVDLVLEILEPITR
jgi:arginase family enzyme